MAKMFDVTKEGKGVSKEQLNKKKGFMLFLDIYFRRFWKLVLLNLIYMTTSIPAIFVSYKFVQYALIFYMQLAGISPENTEAVKAAIGLTPVFVVLIIQFLGTGPATAGFNYVLRKYINDKHAWVWADFVRGMKENWKQALSVYLINMAYTVFATGSFLFYNYVMPDMQVLGIVIFVVSMVFLMIQMYTYQLMVGFKLTLKEIYQNSMILTIVKLPTNMVVAFVSVMMMYILCTLATGMPPGMLLFSFIVIMLVFFSVITLSQLFMTRKIIQKYLIDGVQEGQNKKNKLHDGKEYDIEEKDEEFEDLDDIE